MHVYVKINPKMYKGCQEREKSIEVIFTKSSERALLVFNDASGFRHR